jgi:hypothetical protein
MATSNRVGDAEVTVRSLFRGWAPLPTETVCREVKTTTAPAARVLDTLTIATLLPVCVVIILFPDKVAPVKDTTRGAFLTIY